MTPQKNILHCYPWVLTAQSPNLGVGGGCMEELLEWFNYPCASAHLGFKISCQRLPNWPALSLCPCFIYPNEARPVVDKAMSYKKTDQPVALLTSLHSIRCMQYINFVLQTMSTADDVIVPKRQSQSKLNDDTNCKTNLLLSHHTELSKFGGGYLLRAMQYIPVTHVTPLYKRYEQNVCVS